MKIKKIKKSILILAGLIILSFAFFTAAEEKAATSNNIFLDSDQDGLSDQEEKTYETDPKNLDTDGDGYSDGVEVKSNYDPLKPAPGDSLNPEDSVISTSAGDLSGETNMTADLVEKVTKTMEESQLNGNEVDINQINELVSDTIQEKMTVSVEDEMPFVNPDGIKIKRQSYKSLTPEAREAKKKEDFLKYITTVTYIISSNSPRPITTEADTQSMTNSLIQSISLALTTGNTSGIKNITKGAEKALDQMKELEVPESELDLHVKGLTFLNYTLTFKEGLRTNPLDPLASIMQYSKVQNLVESSSAYALEVEDRLAYYGISLNQTIGSITGTAPADNSTETAPKTADQPPVIKAAIATSVASVPETGGNVTFTFSVRNASPSESVTITSLSDSIYGTLDGDTGCKIGTVLAANGICSFSLEKMVVGPASGPDQINIFTAHAKNSSGTDALDTAYAVMDFTKIIPAENQSESATDNSSENSNL